MGLCKACCKESSDSKSRSCKACEKNCLLKARHDWFQVLFWLAVVLSVVECILAICILFNQSRLDIALLSVNLNQVSTYFKDIRFKSLKDIATTVGLTGILFAWLLQVIGDKTCGIVMDELFQWEYPHYLWQILLFIKSALLCIYTCDSASAGRTVALASFIGMLCGIANMWLMCATFLFSTGARRRVGFCFLRVHLNEQWDMALLDTWAQELVTCANRGETEFIQAYFDAIVKEVNKLSGWPRVKTCNNAVTTLWEAVGSKKWYVYLPYVLRFPVDMVRYDMLAAYLLQAAKRQKQVENTARYKMVAECFGQGANSRYTLPKYVVETYLAFFAIYAYITETSADDLVFSVLGKFDWEKPIAPDPDRHEEILRTVFRHYAVSYSYDYEGFEKKYWSDDLKKQYDMYIRHYQSGP